MKDAEAMRLGAFDFVAKSIDMGRSSHARRGDGVSTYSVRCSCTADRMLPGMCSIVLSEVLLTRTFLAHLQETWPSQNRPGDGVAARRNESCAHGWSSITTAPRRKAQEVWTPRSPGPFEMSCSGT